MLPESRYDSLIAFYALKWGRDPKQVKRQMRMESAFNPRAKNTGSGAMGLLQFMPRTWEEWCDGTAGIQPPQVGVQPRSAYNPEENLNAGCAYMAALEKQFGRLDYALAAYNFGPGNVGKVLRSWGAAWMAHLPAETKNYVIRGMGYSEESLVVG